MPIRRAVRRSAPALTLALTVLAALAAPAAGQAAAAEPGQDAPRVVAHRGASGHAPENTVAAAEAAAELGARWVETDVQRTADGELVLVHDETLERTTNAEEVFPDRAPWNVSDFTAAEIAQLDAGSWYGEEFAGEPVPTLTEFLAVLEENGQDLLLELKSPELYPGIEQEVLVQLAEQGWLGEDAAGELVIQSFNADSVRTVHELEPSVTTGFLGTPDPDELASYAEFADQINPRYTDLTAGYVAAVQELTGPHGRPLEVQTWTVNEPEDAVRVAALGVDGIITDVPDVVDDALAG